jgi:uncharacterized protein with NRDE domain
MCTLAVYRGVSPLYPLLVAANRDEFLGRASAPPQAFAEAPGVFAGRDLVAGGTWLGARIDGSGRVAGLLNRRPAPDRAASGPGERSRGLLCLEALGAGSLDEVLGALDADQASRYGGFNLFLAEPGRGLVLDNGSGVRTTVLEPGLSVLTNLDVNDPRCPRLAGATALFASLTPRVAAGESSDELMPALAAVLGDHGAGQDLDAGPFSRVCVHAEGYGTRSSSVVFVDVDGRVQWFHADGPPCEAAFRRVYP